MSKIRETLTWVTQLLKSDKKFRQELKARTLFWIAREGFKDKPTIEGKALVDSLEDKSEFEFVGFAPNTMYVKADAKDPKHLNSIWIHPWGSATLVYASKKQPIVILANPGIRFNDTILNELELKQEDFKLMGLTG